MINRLVESLTVKNLTNNIIYETETNGSYKLIQVTDSWYCIRCGNCCLVDFEDKWLDYIGVVSDEESSSGKCSNLRFEKNKFSCAIYSRRPNACRAFPFSLRKQEDGKYKLVIHAKCKGFGVGRVIDIKQKIIQCLRYSNKEFHKRIRFDFRTFDEENSVALIK